LLIIILNFIEFTINSSTQRGTLVHINVWNQVFYENDLDSTETLLNDWKLIQEAEKNYNPDNCMSAKEAYYKGLEYINNLK